MYMDLTVKEAERIAALHEDEDSWDFWEYLRQITEDETTSVPQNYTEQEAAHA